MDLECLKNGISRNPAARALLLPVLLARRAMARRRDAISSEVVRNLRRVVAEDPVIHLPEFEGTFCVDSRSDLFGRIARDGHYEPELAAICLRYLDRTRDAIDIGANVGFYTNLLAKELSGRRVLAVEPTSNALRRLRMNLQRNGVSDRTLVFEGVASDTVGSTTINTIVGREEYSSVGAMVHPSIQHAQYEQQRVAATTVDALVESHGLRPGFMKIDVEGFEHAVLRGASRTLHEHQPVVLSELSDTLLRRNGSSAAAVVQFMRDHDYDVFDPMNPGARFVGRAFGDMVCIPRGMARVP